MVLDDKIEEGGCAGCPSEIGTRQYTPASRQLRDRPKYPNETAVIVAERCRQRPDPNARFHGGYQAEDTVIAHCEARIRRDLTQPGQHAVAS